MKKMIPLVSAFVLGSALTAALVRAEPQPHMKTALERLQSAREELSEAKHDKGGHRAKAVELVSGAIEEVKKGIDAADKE